MTTFDDSDESVVIDDDVRDYLEHHGVKGMKWGVRRTVSASPSTDRKKVDKALEKQSIKGTKALTNKELGDLNKRLQMETTLKQLQTPKNKNLLKKGNGHIKEILTAGATLAAVLTFTQSNEGKVLMRKFGLERPPGLHYR